MSTERPCAAGTPESHDTVRLIIVGGCFPVQHNVAPDRLYHRTLVSELARAGVEAEVSVVRYERLDTCAAKVDAAVGSSSAPDDTVLFHLRTEPVMRVTKLFFKYRDEEGRLRRSLSLPGLARLAAQRDDPRETHARDGVPALPFLQHRRIRRLLVTANYLAGAMVGNRARALRRYRRLVADVQTICRARRVRLVVVGPASRPHTSFENRLSERVNAAFAHALSASNVAYVPILGHFDERGIDLFFPNGIYVSPAGHDRVGGLLARRLLEQNHAFGSSSP